MYYTVYKITNLVNNKIYIGVHKTSDLSDDYMGSGKLIKRAIEKYGIENFKKEYIEIFDNSDDMFNMESRLVNEEFIKRDDTYNLSLGGQGGDRADFIDYDKRSENQEWVCMCSINSKKATEVIKWLYENDNDWITRKNEKYTKSILEYYEKGGKNGFFGKTHSDETKEKLSGHKRQTGHKNSQFGTMWIHSLTEKVSKKIKQDELSTYQRQGWLKGRKIRF